MKIIHKFNKKEVEDTGSSKLFISSNQGGYISFGSPNDSQYQGWFHFSEEDWELYKSIESISIDKVPDKIIYYGNYFERISKRTKETFILNDDSTLTYAINNYEGLIKLNLDFRKIHDFDDKGRIYKYYFEKGCLIVEYKKFLDNSLNKLKEKKFLVIKGHFDLDKVDSWISKKYTYDALRKTKSDFFIFNGFNLKVHAKTTDLFIVFKFGSDKNMAIRDCTRSYYSSVKFSNSKNIISKNIILNNATIAFNNLVTRFNNNNNYGIFAGLPWFYQVWSRDELISSIGCLFQKQYWLMKEIILKQWNFILETGFLSNRWPKSDLSSADGIGWLYKRTSDFILKLEKEELLDDYFDQEELIFIYVKLIKSLENIRKTNMKDGLIFNHALETWMDTKGSSTDVRSGFRVEIQALHLIGLKLASKLSTMFGLHTNEYKKLELNLVETVNKKFVDDGILRDGIEFDNSIDFKVRPNVFLAYYIYPELLNNKQWKKTFDLALHECWLDWGGISSISKKDPLFCERHSGINNESYHRGDSWYFINNITAICLSDFDEQNRTKTYTEFIKKIKDASIHEMMFLGFIGQCAELSDAKERNSRGCLAQAWSAATLLELLYKTKEI